MKRLLISAAALTLLGAPAAFAQDSNDHHDRGQRDGGGQWQGRGGGQQQQQQPQQQQQSQQQQGGRQWSGASNTNQSQGRGQQSGGQPDWNAYYRNNPDLQRAYRQNQQSPTYHESVDAFAQRHYLEHGKAEGRALPTSQGDGQSHAGMRYDQSSGWIPAQPQGRQYQQQGRGGDSRYQGQQSWQGGDRYRSGQSSGNRDWRSYQRNTWSQHRYRLPEYRWPRGFNYRRYTYGQYLPEIFFGQDYWIYDYADYSLPYPPPGTVWVRYGPDALLIDRDSGEIVQVIYGVFY